jgi:hypothetical protein
MMRPKDDFDWYSLWADTLQGVGAGLLQYDGSRLAQAALMGLDAFDAAQQRRGRWNPSEPEDSMETQEAALQTPSWLAMSPAEWAAFVRLSPGQQGAHMAERAEVESTYEPQITYRHPRMGGGEPGIPQAPLAGVPPSKRPLPLSASPFEGWSVASMLPFGLNGALNIPSFRR